MKKRATVYLKLYPVSVYIYIILYIYIMYSRDTLVGDRCTLYLGAEGSKEYSFWCVCVCLCVCMSPSLLGIHTIYG